MRTVYIKSQKIADELCTLGYQYSKNQALRASGVFCFEADNKLVELLESAYDKADYVVDPLQRYTASKENV